MAHSPRSGERASSRPSCTWGSRTCEWVPREAAALCGAAPAPDLGREAVHVGIREQGGCHRGHGGGRQGHWWEEVCEDRGPEGQQGSGARRSVEGWHLGGLGRAGPLCLGDEAPSAPGRLAVRAPRGCGLGNPDPQRGQKPQGLAVVPTSRPSLLAGSRRPGLLMAPLYAAPPWVSTPMLSTPFASSGTVSCPPLHLPLIRSALAPLRAPSSRKSPGA